MLMKAAAPAARGNRLSTATIVSVEAGVSRLEQDSCHFLWGGAD
jgi:hypothetical protein